MHAKHLWQKDDTFQINYIFFILRLPANAATEAFTASGEKEREERKERERGKRELA